MPRSCSSSTRCIRTSPFTTTWHFPLRSPAHREPESAIRTRVTEIASLLHIDDKLASRGDAALGRGRCSASLSAAALVRHPSIYLMDEPLSSLDAQAARRDARGAERASSASSAPRFLYVTHDQTEAMTLATNIGVLDRGRLVQFRQPSRDLRGTPVNA
jgi:multiple sugar transport system ATP-binding protein